MDTPIELRQLRYFVAVAEELHFGRAAERLHMSQSPLSRAIRELEREIGVVLFVRATRRVELTPAGSLLFERARRALAEIDGAVADARRLTPSGDAVLRLGYGPFSGVAATRIVEVLRAERPINSFFQPDAATVDYGVAKAAVVNLSKSLSQEFGPKGIRVNCVSPGQVSTDLWLGEHGVAATFADAAGVDADTIRTTAAAAIPTGRFSTPQEVATPVTMLASDRTSNVTGVNYVIDGGLIKTT